jgi:hypothetical protein
MIWYQPHCCAVVVCDQMGTLAPLCSWPNLLLSILCRIHVAEMSAAPHTARVFRTKERKKGGDCNRDDVLADVSQSNIIIPSTNKLREPSPETSQYSTIWPGVHQYLVQHNHHYLHGIGHLP